jgi:hypothetical protein
MLAEGVPESMELSAHGFNVTACRLSAILGVFDHSRPRLGRVAEAREIHGHGLFPPPEQHSKRSSRGERQSFPICGTGASLPVLLAKLLSAKIPANAAEQVDAAIKAAKKPAIE